MLINGLFLLFFFFEAPGIFSFLKFVHDAGLLLIFKQQNRFLLHLVGSLIFSKEIGDTRWCKF